MKRSLAAAVAGAAALALALTGCSGSGGSSGSKTIKVAYQTTATFNSMQVLMERAKKQFESAHKGVTVDLVPIKAEGADYYTKLALMNRASSTAPDVQYEDTFKIQSDSAAGYLAPLDTRLSSWSDWSKFNSTAKQAGIGAGGKTYGIPLGTDTRGLWYNIDLFKKAGISTPWEPKTWADVLTAAKTIKAKLPNVIPMNVYTGKAAGEAASMQGFQMLLSGTKSSLYDSSTKKWVLGSTGFRDSLQFVSNVYRGGLGPTAQQALDPNIFTNVAAEWLPKSKLAIALDGSWMSSTWIKGGTNPWSAWSSTLGIAPMPTEDGQSPGSTSMSGGWTLALGAKSSNADLAFQFMTTALNEENSLSYDVDNSQIAVRTDVAQASSYTTANPSFTPFSKLVAVTHFRPTYTGYDQVSNAIQVAMESVTTGQQTPAQAQATYDSTVASAVGSGKTESGS